MVSVAMMVFVCVAGCITLGPTFDESCAAAVKAQADLLNRYIADKKFGERLPKLEGAALNKFLSGDFTEQQKAIVRKKVEEEFNQGKARVFSSWVEFKSASIKTAAMKLVGEAQASATNGLAVSRAKFEAAREIIWRESVNAALEGVLVPQVNTAVRQAAGNLLDGTVNVAEWNLIEKDMNRIASEAIRKGIPTNGIAALRAYPDIRTYTSVLDERVRAIVNELGRLGVSKQGRDKIVEQTIKFMLSAARLMDAADVTRTVTTQVKKEEVKIDETIYRRLLEEYKQSLLLYDCTSENTGKVIDWMATQIARMIAELPKPTQTEPTTTTSLVIDRLGATAVNKRIAALREKLVVELEDVIRKNEALLSQLRDKLGSGDVEDARNQALALLRGADAADMARSAIARHELLAKINPALWRKIEKEIRDATEKFGESGELVKGIAWLAAYPPVRTYAEEIDVQFKEIENAAIAFGVAKERAAAVMGEVAKLAAEAENLACYVDEEHDLVVPGKKIPKEMLARYEAQLANCRKVLLRNDCTKANADKLLGTIRARFAAEIAGIEADTHKSMLLLGANAINVRLAKLKEECAHALVGRCVSDLISAGKFADARKVLRDVALSGDDAFDKLVYASRLGAINTIVNPAQLAALESEAKTTVDNYWEKGDFRALREWIDGYPYVHESYPDVLKALDSIKKCMLSLTVEEPAATNYVAQLNGRIQELIEASKGGKAQKAPAPDLKPLEEALGLLEQAVMAQYYNKEAAELVISRVRKEVLAMLKKDVVSISTADLNAKLKAFIEQTVRNHAAADAEKRPSRFKMLDDPLQEKIVVQTLLNAAQKGVVGLSAGKTKEDILAEMSGTILKPSVEWLAKLWENMNAPKELPSKEDAGTLAFDKLMTMLVDRQEYLELLDKMDQELVYDSQIAMAEDAIAKQLGRKPHEPLLHVNAILGEYARAMRLLKRKGKLTKALGTAVVLGAVYLDQPAVLDRALELGADIDGVYSRDPLGRTGLLLAVQLGRTAFIQRLVSNGAKESAVDADGNGVLHYAVRRGNISVLKAMLSKADVNAKNKAGETALFDAARSNQPALVDMLVEAKVDVSVCAANGESAFDAACRAGSRDVLDKLADAGSEYGPKQLIIAAECDRLAVAQWLVARGVDVNAPGVMEAAKDSEAVKCFLVREGGTSPMPDANTGSPAINSVDVPVSSPAVEELPKDGKPAEEKPAEEKPAEPAAK